MVPLRALVRDLAAVLLYRTGVTRPGRGRAAIVTFHRVLPAAELAEYPSPGIAVTPEELAWFLDFFQGLFTCGTLRGTMDGFLAGDSSARPLLAITFDDGQLDNHRHARPVLAAAGVRATFYVVAGAAASNQALWHDRLGFALRAWLARAPDAARAFLSRIGVASHAIGAAIEATKTLGPEAIAARVAEVEAAVGGPAVPPWDGMMGWTELRQMAAEGHEIGSHSLSHPILPLCDDARLREEIAGSRQALQAGLGASVDSFCYPNGDHDDRVVAAVAAAGYRYAVTTTWGANDRTASPFRLRRCDIQGATSRSAAGGLSAARLAWRLSGLHPGLGTQRGSAARGT
jgi:peptidoglycan/xylan/chitin deacetylase (PgdA/CDA1 family)